MHLIFDIFLNYLNNFMGAIDSVVIFVVYNVII